MQPVLEIEALSKRYKDEVLALDSVNLTIAQGEIFALLGPNGAGKTTLIGAVCGLVKKSSGKIRLFGADLDKDPVAPRFGVGLVPQEVNFDPFFTVEESLRIQLGYYGKTNDPARIAEVLEAMNLSAKAGARTRELSGGMKRRLLIGKALVHRPKLLFLDEPTAGVDVELRRDLWTYVRKLRDAGTTIILTTHYLEEAEELADRIGVINEGKLRLVEEKNALMRRLGEKKLALTLKTAIPAMTERLRSLGAHLSEDGRGITYVERAGCAPASDVLATVYANGAEVVDVETRRSKLEDVFIELMRHPPQEQR